MTELPPLPVTAADVSAAAAVIAPFLTPTPSAPSPALGELTGADVVVKFENLQFTGSFKERGALHRLLKLDAEQRARGVIAMSAGNHAQAVAHHAHRLGIHAVVVMPRDTAFVKVQRTRALGAEVVQHGDDLAEAHAHAIALAEQDGFVYLSPYDDADVIAGQGTVAIELLGGHPDLDVLVVPVGGGGLLAGMAVAARELAPDVEIVGVQAAASPAFADAFAGSEEPSTAFGETIADGIAVPHPGALTLEIARRTVDGMLTVGEPAIESAVGAYLEIEHVVAEGAGAASLAALLEHPARFRGRRVGLVLSGGNIDPRLLASVIVRSLLRSGRLARLRIGVRDTPGNLARVAAVVGEQGANIVEVVHRRDLPALHLKTAEVDLTIETRDDAHADAVVAALEAAGFLAGRERVEP